LTIHPAYCVHQDFGPDDGGPITFDRHYLLYAASGSMRLEAAGRTWSLPPARAAWIAAGAPIRVTIPNRITCCSVLFAPDSYAAPTDPLTVFEMTPLARAIILECRAFGPDMPALPLQARQMFDLLATIAAQLSARPSLAWLPSATTAPVRAALAATEDAIGDAISFDAIARAARSGPRTLARRFTQELGMSWSQAQRRLRMIRAAERLAETRDPVTTVALSVGYSSSSAFNTAFRDLMGTTPTAFRASLELI
jgi:AraC-like DNA-binding protein